MSNEKEKDAHDDAYQAQQPQRKPKFKSVCVWFLVVFAFLVLVISGLGLAFAIPKFVNGLAFQRALYYKGPLPARSAVVHPLIGPEQKFDLAVSVWIRTDGSANLEEDVKFREDGRRVFAHPVPPSIPLYSDIVFRGLTLKDKNLFASVNFTVPTEFFRKATLTQDDLRGSVVLIPTSPSPLDYIMDYSTWIPDFIANFPVRSWPFPLGSSSSGNKTIADKAIESFGATVPLIQFHNIKKRCDHEGEDFYDQDDEPVPYTTENKAPWTHHPYIITRSQIRIVSETAIFDGGAYVRKHKYLKQTSCKQSKTLFPSIHECQKTYVDVGHVETAMGLNTTDDAGVHDLVYSPYISISKFGGPMDLLPIPINRQYCLDEDEIQEPADDRESVDVTWNLAFSGMSFFKFAMLEEVEKYNMQTKLDMELSEHRQVLAHDDLELSGAIWGYKHQENSHPRRRNLLAAIRLAIATLVSIFDVIYWWSRTTTVGLSTFGTLLIAASKFIGATAPAIAAAMVQNEQIFDWISTVFEITMSLCPFFFVIRTIFRFNRKSTPTNSTIKKWIPCSAPLTHEERKSQRVEDRMNPWTKGAIVLVVFVIYYKFSLHYYPVIPAILPDAKPEDYVHNWLIDSWPYVVFPLDIAGLFFQLWMNWQSRTFAGSLKLTARLQLAMYFTRFVEYVPGVIGLYAARPRLVAHEILLALMGLVAVWQSATLPTVDQDAYTFHVE